ncbi:hypothetical protein [Blastomonas sp.]|uniref:hypothetical protein n=1 Tax=Blastomonas sp. TaxID=1909299 RepID=UPI00391A2577
MIGLRHWSITAALALSIMIAGCNADPLSPETSSRLERVYSDLPPERAVAVIQNLRSVGLYTGGLDTSWNPAIAEAINKAHFEIDYIDGNFDLATDGGAASFVTKLATIEGRAMLADALSYDLAAFTQVTAPSTTAQFKDDICFVEAGEYDRHGERIRLTVYQQRGRIAGINMVWDGWPGPGFPRYLPITFGEETVPLMTEYSQSLPITEARLFNVNGWWVTDGIKRSTNIRIENEDLGVIDLPTGDLYQTGMALTDCVQKHLPERQAPPEGDKPPNYDTFFPE